MLGPTRDEGGTERVAAALIDLRAYEALGRTEVPGLEGRHHFCFARYQHPDRLQWDRLRIWNDCRLEAGASRPPAHCDNFDIVTIVLEGALQRPGRFGRTCQTASGEAQILCAGRASAIGLEAAGGAAVRFHEIWLRSDRRDAAPKCSVVQLPSAAGWNCLASAGGDGRTGLTSNASVLVANLSPGCPLQRNLAGSTHAYLVPISGSVRLNGQHLAQGSGAAISGEERLSIEADAGQAQAVLVEMGAAAALD